jgi:hypothetical protein
MRFRADTRRHNIFLNGWKILDRSLTGLPKVRPERGYGEVHFSIRLLALDGAVLEPQEEPLRGTFGR